MARMRHRDGRDARGCDGRRCAAAFCSQPRAATTTATSDGNAGSGASQGDGGSAGAGAAARAPGQGGSRAGNGGGGRSGNGAAAPRHRQARGRRGGSAGTEAPRRRDAAGDGGTDAGDPPGDADGVQGAGGRDESRAMTARQQIRSRSTLEMVRGGMSIPVLVTHAPDDDTRLFVVERNGQDRDPRPARRRPDRGVHRPGRTRSPPTRTATTTSAACSAWPSIRTTRRTRASSSPTRRTAEWPDDIVTQFEVSASDPNVADPDSERCCSTASPTSPANHNGGMLAFGPDGCLFYRHGRRRRRATTRTSERSEHRTRCSARSCASTSTTPTQAAPGNLTGAGDPAHLGLRPAQPVALQLRPRHRRPLHRRRRPGRVGRDRRRAEGRRATRTTAGKSPRAPTAVPARRAAIRTISTSSMEARSTSTHTAAATTAWSAATCTAAARSRRCRAGTSTGTTARAATSARSYGTAMGAAATSTIVLERARQHLDVGADITVVRRRRRGRALRDDEQRRVPDRRQVRAIAFEWHECEATWA